MQISKVHSFVFAVLTVLVFVAVLLLVSSRINTGTATSALLLSVLIVSRFWGTGPALAAAGLASASYSYYFLPPAGFAIDNPNDWVAFGAFTITAVIVGGLWTTAQGRRDEIERLYRELQASFERAAEAEAARRNDELKAVLLDALTHNLRTPLTAIKVAVTALIGGELGQDDEARREMAIVINEETDRLNRYIGGLGPSKADNDQTPGSARGIFVEDVLRLTLEKCEPVTRDHRLIVDGQRNVAAVAVDLASLVEALFIVIDNAAKYSPRGTRIRVDATTDGPDHVRIAVSDEGPGIPVELRERVFEEFFRIPDGKTPGTGLGLSIARRLLESQGGQIRIEAGPGGRGTSVLVTVPAVRAAPSLQSSDIVPRQYYVQAESR